MPTEQTSELALQITAPPEADLEELAELGQQLRQELLELNVDSVEAVPEGVAPPGAKGDVVSLGSLAVTLAPIVIPPLINLVQSWLSRHEKASVTLEKDGEKLTLMGSPSREQQQVINTWLVRHTA